MGFVWHRPGGTLALIKKGIDERIASGCGDKKTMELWSSLAKKSDKKPRKTKNKKQSG